MPTDAADHSSGCRHRRDSSQRARTSRYVVRMLRNVLLLTLLLIAPSDAQTRKRVLAWGDTLAGYQHDAISHALSTMERLGRASGAFELYIRTDSQWITKQPVALPARNAHNLNDFDAIFYFGTGENLNQQQ